jgi:hypothetical protein
MNISSPLKSSAGGRPPKIPARKKTPLRTRPAKPPVALPKIILTQLHGLSAKVQQISLTEGFLWLALALAGIVLVQATLDWVFDLPWNVRLLFALCDLGLLGWITFHYLLKPMQKPLTPEQAALRAEMRYPVLRTSLISAVQLAKSPEGSTRMVEILVQQVAKRAAQMDFRAAVDAKHLRKLAMTSIALVLVTLGLIAWLMPKSLILLERILLSRQPLPTETIVVAISGDFKIPAGQTIELSAKAQGVLPKSGSVEIDYAGHGSQTATVTPASSSPDTFVLNLPNVQQDLSYRFRLNDGRGEWFKVTIQHGPVLAKVSFRQDYPAYTGLASTQLSAGNLTLLAGSHLHVEGQSDQELNSANIILKGINQTIPMNVAGDRRTVSADSPIPVQGLEGFSVSMQNTDGIDSQNNTLYRVEVVPDKPPEITFAAGQAEDKTFVQADRPEIHFKVVDDFKVEKVFLCVENVAETVAGSDEVPNAEAAPTKEDVTRIPINVPTPAGSLSFDYVWQDAEKSGLWKEGKTVSYWIEAEDNNNVTGPGVGKSGKREWRVITVAEMQKELKDKEKEIAEKMDDAGQKEQELQHNLGNTIKQEAAPENAPK